MATLTELSQIGTDARWNGLVDKVKAAAVKKAVAVVNATSPPASALAWAKATLDNPNQAAQEVIWFTVGDNAAATIDQIFNAADSAIEANVNTAIDKLYAT